MFVHTLSRRATVTAAYAVGLSVAAMLFLYRPQAVATGISRGLSVCGNVIIPTLYPFMLVSGILADSPLCRAPGRLSRGMCRRLFGLPGCCGPVILLSLLGGYPAGALAISRLQRQGILSNEQVNRLLTFCVCGGPGFIVNTVGAGLLGSSRAGWLLFASQATAAVLIGLWQGRGRRGKTDAVTLLSATPRPFAVIIGDTCTALLTMCGFVVAATMVLSLTEALGIPLYLQTVTGVAGSVWATASAVLSEVSCGCIALAGGGENVPFLLSLAMAWAGLSVQGQIAAALPKASVFCVRFWGWRLVHGILAGGLSHVLFSVFPTTLSTLQSGVQALPYTVSATASAMLLILSFLAMLCFSPKKTGNLE